MIAEKYHNYGGAGSLLGPPFGEAHEVGDESGGSFQDCLNEIRVRTRNTISVRQSRLEEQPTWHDPECGAKIKLHSSIYWTEKTGAHAVHGEIRARWLRLGGPRSELGYPTSDEMPTPDGNGRMNQFQSGEIWWYHDRGTKVYLSLGDEP